MAKINQLTVKVTYKVGLHGLSIPKKALDQLTEIHENNKTLDATGINYSDANEWLRNNIRERDCYSCEYEIDVLQ